MADAADPGRSAASPVSERLQKILARAGYGSRRAAEVLILSGRVTVNGAVTRELGVKADPESDIIAVDGAAIPVSARPLYIAMHKPPGYVTTAADPQARRTVMDLLPDGTPPHVLPVGRLDIPTEGLLLFTNDGEFAHRLAHPRYEVEKEYHAFVVGAPDAAALHQLRTGVVIEGRRTSRAEVAMATPPSGRGERVGHTWLRIVIHEGRKRQVRLMFAAVGHQVRTLVRTRVGPVELGTLGPGLTRPLSRQELTALREQLKLPPA